MSINIILCIIIKIFIIENRKNINAIRKAVKELNYTYMEIPSKAVYDSQIMPKITKK
ncbi:hypothetical protein [Acidianus infernus]|uniref:hypothetical protein n=1 Tax=Acidianus infernus TaxID=12915 RepID=UPI0012DBE4A8|nr:hypothetical protein [Acidianus infernus]